MSLSAEQIPLPRERVSTLARCGVRDRCLFFVFPMVSDLQLAVEIG